MHYHRENKTFTCKVCNQNIKLNDDKRCKLCEYYACTGCTRLEGRFFGLLGKRYCINCILVLKESNELSSKQTKIKKIIQEEKKQIEKFSEKRLENPVNIPAKVNHINKKLPDNPDDELRNVLELSKKTFEEDQRKKNYLENQKLAQSKLDSNEDELVEKALQLSIITLENEKKNREGQWEDLKKFDDHEKGPKIFQDNFSKEASILIHIEPNSEQEPPELNYNKIPELKNIAPVEKEVLKIEDKNNLTEKSLPFQNGPPIAPPLPAQYANLLENSLPLINHGLEFIPPPALNLNIIKSPQLEEAQIIKTDPKLDYDLVKKLATGSMGTVYIAKNISTEDHCAIKIIETNSVQEESLIVNEVKLTINSHHKNIITYFKCYHFEKTFWVIEELMSCSLADLILDMPERIPEKIISYILKSVIEAIHYLHSNNRLHRDIKSDNVLLNLNGEIKLGDLGFAAQLESRNQLRNTFAGTLLWMSPELLNQRPYTYKTDIWSLGIVAYELAQGEPPYYREGQQRIVVNILNQEPPRLKNEERWSKEFSLFLEKCLVKDPDFRADTRDLLDDSFITGCHTSEDEFRQFFNEWLENR